MPFSSKLKGIEDVITTKERFLANATYEELLAKVKGIEFVSPEVSDAELSGLKEQNLGFLTKNIPLETGRNLGADAVLLGSISEYREREGGDLGVSSPASVAFSIQLLDVSSGEILWEDYFAETQRPLSENVLEVKKFFQRGAKWITADQLAKEGVAEVVDELSRFLVQYSSTN